MPITASLPEDEQAVIDRGGPLDADQVYFQFVCSTGGGAHDPNGSPDDRVRPEHACLHGTIWRLDDPGAPIPPLSYGCRCAMRYVAKPGTTASRVLDDASGSPETSQKAPAKRYLEEHAPEWQQIAKAAADAPPAQSPIAVAYDSAKELGYSRDIARMALDVQPPPPQVILGTGPLSGVGRACRILVERWRSGDMQAAADLKRKYPATYVRILTEERLQPV